MDSQYVAYIHCQDMNETAAVRIWVQGAFARCEVTAAAGFHSHQPHLRSRPRLHTSTTTLVQRAGLQDGLDRRATHTRPSVLGLLRFGGM